MFHAQKDQIKYIKDNYLDVADSRINDSHWDLLCDKCNIVRGFQVVKRHYTNTGTEYYT